MIVLGVESSCDETAAAVVTGEGRVLSDAVSSQVKLHAPFGGVVPELAARAHIENVVPVLSRALEGAGLGLADLDGVTVTQGPGLVGALLVGVQAGKALSMAADLPLVGVNHLVGHLLAVHLFRGDAPRPQVDYPYVALLVSGGHTALYEVRSSHDIEQLGQTRDDAAGEAFDKVAKLLGLGYPGGPRVDELAARGRPERIALPKPLAARRNLEFSFSGLKTAVSHVIAELGPERDEQTTADICASFQKTVVEVLVKKALLACEQRGIARLVITGGVAANRGLRQHAERMGAERKVAVFIPPLASCTDNAAMIAYAGAQRLLRGERDDLSLEVFSRSPILGASAERAERRYRSQRLPRA